MSTPLLMRWNASAGRVLLCRPSAGPARATRRRGMAIVEMVVGLVGLLAVFAGMLCIVRLGRERSVTLQEARAKAGAFAMADDYISDTPGPDFIYDWSTGNDGRKHSADDEPILGSAEPARRRILAVARPDDLDRRVPGNQLSPLNRDSFVNSLGLVHGREDSDRVMLPPVVRHLLYDAEYVRIESDAWMVWTKDLY
jgi:hypothetical protein